MHVTANRTELYVDIEGPELTIVDGQLQIRPTVLVLHGGPGFDQGYLRPGLRALADDAQLVFVDLRGQGRSSPAPAASCTLEQMADDVAALCAVLGIPHPILFGHSAGGFVALHVAVRHPELAHGLILCHTAATLAPIPDPAPPPGPLQRGGPDAVAAAARLFAGDFSPQAGQAFDRLVFPLYAAPGREHIPPQLMAHSTLNTAIAAHFFQQLAPRYDLRTSLPTISAPTLIIVGHHDWICPPSAGRLIAAAMPNARLVELPDAGHFGFSETPTPFLDATRSYLADLTTTPTANQPTPSTRTS